MQNVIPTVVEESQRLSSFEPKDLATLNLKVSRQACLPTRQARNDNVINNEINFF